MASDRLVWIVGLAAAAVGVGVAVAVAYGKQKPSPAPPPLPTPPPAPNPPPVPPQPPPPPPPPPVPSNPQWVPTVSIDPGKMYRVSVPGASSTIIAQAITSLNVGGIYPPGTAPPSDWPGGDTTDLTRWRAQFTNTTALSVPLPSVPGGDLKLWVRNG